MDELLLALSNVSSQVLPIAGALALIFLCVVLNRLWKLLEAVTATVKNLDPTLKLVDQSIEKVQAPLDTVVKLSHTVDDVRDKAADSIVRLSAKTAEGTESLKNFVQEKKNKITETVEEVTEDE